MFEYMNSGLQYAVTGLQVNAEKLGLVIASGQRAKRRKQGKKQDLPGPEPGAPIILGPSASEYTLVDEDYAGYLAACDIVSHMMETAKVLKWPDSEQNFKTCVDEWVSWARTVRKFRSGKHGLDGGQDPRHQYKVLSLIRVMIMILWDRAPFLENMSFAELTQYMPDEHEHLSKVARTMTAHETRCMFGCHPCLVSCYACLAGWMKLKEQQKLLEAPDSQVLAIVDNFY
jgi:hypothetical protein